MHARAAYAPSAGIALGASCSRPRPAARTVALLIGAILALALALTAAPAALAAGWTIQPTPDATGPEASVTAAVSCGSSTACVSVGDATDETGRLATLAQAWDGSAWTIIPTPNPTGEGSSELDAVSCVSATECTAVGDYVDSAGDTLTLIETWDGHTWTIQSSPDPAGAAMSSLNGVSCSSTSSCMAVGDYLPAGLYQARVPFAESWDGTSWTLQSVPSAALSSTALNSVSCSAPTACTAVGGSAIDTSPVPLVARWDGTSWTIQSTPAVPGGDGNLDGVNCTSADSCIAVGTVGSIPYTYTQLPLAETWNGTSWTIQSTPDPSGSTNTGFLGLSCTAATTCTAVGFATSGTAVSTVLVEGWDGTRWTAVPTPGGTGALSGVSCQGPAECIAVGNGLAEAWNGSSWAIVPTPSAVGATGDELIGVSCASAGSCESVGVAGAAPLAEGWNGSSWTPQGPPAPAGARSSVLFDVSCASAGACEAVGSYVDSAGTTDALAESWNGTSWSQQTIPGPPTESVILLSLSCPSTTSCTAAGWEETSAAQSTELVDAWDGTSWTQQSTQTPAGARGDYFSGVSCVGPTTCTAAGTWYASALVGGDGPSVNLVESDASPPPVCTQAPSITEQPTSLTITVGESATVTAAASTPPNCQPPTLQWQASSDGGTTFVDVPGATSSSLTGTPTTAQSGDELRAVFTNAAGSTDSSPATVTVQAPPTPPPPPSLSDVILAIIAALILLALA